MTKYLLLVLMLVVGCGDNSLSSTKETGSVKIAIANFDYHQTLEFPDGREIEFYHCQVQESLFEEGATVDIQYKGSGESVSDCANIDWVKVVKHSDDYVKDHPELWPPRKGYWDHNNYYIDGNDAVCGSIETSADGGFSAYSNGDLTRKHEYTVFKTRDSAKAEIEKDCR